MRGMRGGIRTDRDVRQRDVYRLAARDRRCVDPVIFQREVLFRAGSREDDELECELRHLDPDPERGRRLFDSLPADQRKVIDDCGYRIERDLAAFLDDSEKGFQDEFAGVGIEIHEMSPEQIAAFSSAVDSVEEDFVTRLSSRNLPAQQALDEFKAALEQ